MTERGITIIESKVGRYEEVERFYSDAEILELFPDGDGSMVNPLLRRAQAAEAELALARHRLDCSAYDIGGVRCAECDRLEAVVTAADAAGGGEA